MAQPRRPQRLHTEFRKANKGFEGLVGVTFTMARANAPAGWRSTARSPRGRRPSTGRRRALRYRLEDQRRDLLGAVDADRGAEHPAARAVATRLVRCQSEALTHYASTLAAARRAVNRNSELNELRAKLAELRALMAARPRREPKRNGP